MGAPLGSSFPRNRQIPGKLRRERVGVRELSPAGACEMPSSHLLIFSTSSSSERKAKGREGKGREGKGRDETLACATSAPL